MTTSVSPGLLAIRAEMARQHADALASFHDAAPVAQAIAASLRRTGRLILTGMGGSHYMNRVAEVLFRRAGIDAVALAASELLYAPLPDTPSTVLLVSQSGGSAEIVRLLEQPVRSQERFGLTLDGASPLGTAVPCLVGAGGREKAFAATRSLLVTLALLAAVLKALGCDLADAPAYLAAPQSVPENTLRMAAERLAACPVVALSGRMEFQGIAEAGGLCLMELARIPTVALESGQFRHGPLEMLEPSLGAILLRAPGETAALTARLADTLMTAGIEPVIFDLSGEEPVDGALTVAFPRLTGVAAAFALLPALQTLLIDVAARRVPDVGLPRRSTKVTDTE